MMCGGRSAVSSHVAHGGASPQRRTKGRAVVGIAQHHADTVAALFEFVVVFLSIYLDSFTLHQFVIVLHGVRVLGQVPLLSILRSLGIFNANFHFRTSIGGWLFAVTRADIAHLGRRRHTGWHPTDGRQPWTATQRAGIALTRTAIA